MPTPILDLQRRAQIVGELRMGEQVATGRGDNTRPAALTEWRLTSRDKELLTQVAKMYGGEVQPWDGNPGEWELYTKSSEITIIVHPQQSEPAQQYEMWSKTGNLRRCGGSGTPCTVTDEQTGERKIVECFCDTLPEKEQCSLMTRFKFEIAGVPTLGLWSFQTKGYFAATELPTQVQMLLNKFNSATLAVLAIEPREIDQKGQPKKKFKVPVLRYRPNLAQGVLERGGVRDASQVQMLVAPTPVHALPASPVLRPGEVVIPNTDDMVAEQVEAHVVDDEPAAAQVVTEEAMTPVKAYAILGVTADNVGDLKAALKQTGVDVNFGDFAKVQAESGVKGPEEFLEVIKRLNPSAFEATPVESVAVPNPPPGDPDHDPFAVKVEQEGLGGLV